MTLDWRVCSRARLARDPRFDGKFFIAVLSTGIYCRSICRARTSRESNVRYFPSAAAAAEAGFRPCLRCRPECSPGTPAWVGTQTTVSRALRLISESGLEAGGVEALAEHLGVGSRHLRRLFLKHLGATPSAVAHTRRLHFAKKLIDETRLPMTQVAIASGFGCVRRFNAAFRTVYHRTPTHIRRLAHQKGPQAENRYLFHLHFRPPYDWKRMLDFLASRATPGVELVEQDRYSRSFSLSGNPGYFEVAFDEGSNALALHVEIGEPRLLFVVVERVRTMFDLDADWEVIARTLRTDPTLARCAETHPGLRVPGCWYGFELATQAILAQRIASRTALVLAARLVQAFGRPFQVTSRLTHLFPTPEVLADADLRWVGLGAERAAAIRNFARVVCDRKTKFDRITDSETFLTDLRAIPGVAEGTAQYVAMRALREPDAFPARDMDLARVLGLKRTRELEQRSLAWKPWRAYAAMYLWSVGANARPPETRPFFSATEKITSGKNAFRG